jgi:hypothetical protein
MSSAGSDAAIETADIALMTDDLSWLPWLIGTAANALDHPREHRLLAWNKALFVVLPSAGYPTLWGAIAAGVGASVFVADERTAPAMAGGSTRHALGVPAQAPGGPVAAGAISHRH